MAQPIRDDFDAGAFQKSVRQRVRAWLESQLNSQPIASAPDRYAEFISSELVANQNLGPAWTDADDRAFNAEWRAFAGWKGWRL